MKQRIKWFGLISMLYLLHSCAAKEKQTVMTAVFDLGQIRMIHTEKETPRGTELTLMTRFMLKEKGLNVEMSNYFQYQLGSRIKIVVGKDTIRPVLDYYLPLIDVSVKEINSKYMLSEADMNAPKRIIINDTILGLNKVNILFK
jgi:hypothetical protein